MHKCTLNTLAASVIAAAAALTSPAALAKQQTPTSILGNQVGYSTYQSKVAVTPNVKATEFTLVDTTNERTVYTGKLSKAKSWSEAKETVKTADFSSFHYPGEYRLEVEGVSQPFMVRIGNGIYENALEASIKSYYYNRAGAALQKEHAGVFQRPAAHPDTVVYVHESAADERRPVGTVLSLPKGWYDAGDYGKYIVNSSITVHTLLRALENKPELFAKMNLNIPESNNNTPDLLDEILWNLDWMVSMQDSDGGVYHKLTPKRFEPLAMPHTDYESRYVVLKTTAAALDFASSLAVASRVFQQYESQFPGRSEQYKQAALNAWAWAEKNPNVIFSQPDGFNTGHYKLSSDDYKDEWAWARAELFVLTGKKKFLKEYVLAEEARVPEWSDVETLGMLALANYEKTPKKLKQQVIEKLVASADNWVKQSEKSGYGVPMFGYDFRWGSNGVAANKAMALMDINKLVSNPAYIKTAESLVDYILGRNPNNKSYVSGFGSNPMMYPHHRVSEADGVKAPIPGMLAGGPHTGYQDKKECETQLNLPYENKIPAKSYQDHWCSYATNEIAINWNAGLVYILTEMN